MIAAGYVVDVVASYNVPHVFPMSGKDYVFWPLGEVRCRKHLGHQQAAGQLDVRAADALAVAGIDDIEIVQDIRRTCGAVR